MISMVYDLYTYTIYETYDLLFDWGLYDYDS